MDFFLEGNRLLEGKSFIERADFEATEEILVSRHHSGEKAQSDTQISFENLSQENSEDCLTLLHPGFSRYCHPRGGVRADPPLVSQLWGPKNSRTQISQTDMVLSFHLSS